jgi:ABC-type uncharacterized transport system permease subunit
VETYGRLGNPLIELITNVVASATQQSNDTFARKHFITACFGSCQSACAGATRILNERLTDVLSGAEECMLGLAQPMAEVWILVMLPWFQFVFNCIVGYVLWPLFVSVSGYAFPKSPCPRCNTL